MLPFLCERGKSLLVRAEEGGIVERRGRGRRSQIDSIPESPKLLFIIEQRCRKELLARDESLLFPWRWGGMDDLEKMIGPK